MPAPDWLPRRRSDRRWFECETLYWHIKVKYCTVPVGVVIVFPRFTFNTPSYHNVTVFAHFKSWLFHIYDSHIVIFVVSQTTYFTVNYVTWPVTTTLSQNKKGGFSKCVIICFIWKPFIMEHSRLLLYTWNIPATHQQLPVLIGREISKLGTGSYSVHNPLNFQSNWLQSWLAKILITCY